MPDFDESQHPRAQDGKFTAGGADLKAWGKGQHDLKAGGEGIRKWSAQGAEKDVGRLSNKSRRWTDWRPKGLTEQSWTNHWTGNPDDDASKPTAERQKTIDAIRHKTLDGVPPAAPGEQKMAIFTMGGPGSGKSSMTASARESGKFVAIDPDSVREQLPEYKQSTSGPLTYRYAAAMTHPEASRIAKDMIDEAIKRGQHMIIDGTGKTAKTMIAKMEQLRKAGYHIHLAYAHLDETDGVARVAQRAEGSGRYVAENVVRDAYKKIPWNFERVAKAADTWAVHDTAQKGSPMVWMKGEDGKEQQLDEDFVSGFHQSYARGGRDIPPAVVRERALL